MKSKPLCCFALASILLFACFGRSQAVNGVEVGGGLTASVFKGKTSEVRVLDENGNAAYTIPIDEHPGQFVFSKGANTLYIVHSGKKEKNYLAAVNLTTKKVENRIDIGSGYFVRFIVFDDTDRLYCLTYSNRAFAVFDDYMSHKSLKAPYYPVLTVIDTKTNKMVASYQWLDEFESDLTKHKNNAFIDTRMLVPSSRHSISVVTSAIWGGHPLLTRVTTFFEDPSVPTSNVDIDKDQEVSGSIESKDGEYLILATNDKRKSGFLETVDLRKNSSKRKELSVAPTGLFRLGPNGNIWVLGAQEMQAVSENGELLDQRIPLSKASKATEGDDSDNSAFVNGFPGETITLGTDYAAIQINAKNGRSKHRVALVNLKERKLEVVLLTMSSAEISGIRTGRFLGALALSLATGGYVIFVPNWALKNESLAAKPDGSYLYTLDAEGHEVSIFNVKTAALIKRIKVNRDITRIKVSEGGRHLICFGRKTQQVDLEKLELVN